MIFNDEATLYDAHHRRVFLICRYSQLFFAAYTRSLALTFTSIESLLSNTAINGVTLKKNEKSWMKIHNFELNVLTVLPQIHCKATIKCLPIFILKLGKSETAAAMIFSRSNTEFFFALAILQ